MGKWWFVAALLSTGLLLAGCQEQPLTQPTAAEASTPAPSLTTTPPVAATPASTRAATATAAPTHTPRYVTVRYRSDPVDIANPAFEYLNTAGSSLVGGAWYDASNGYMVIKLTGTYYHYCGMPQSAWSQFAAASSYGSHYNAAIKGRYGCQGVAVPDY